MILRHRLVGMLALLLCALGARETNAQLTNILFFDDFTGGEIDTNRYSFQNPLFEGGKGTFDYAQANGVLEITGTVSEQWWPGATLEVNQRFNVSPETNIVVSVDRVAELGEGTASRSALWIMDSTKSYYVLFADVRAEGGWRFNRKIGLSTSDNPTGSGTDITQFNPVIYDNAGLHQMKLVADGANVRLYLDNVAGPSVRFPFSSNLVVQVGSFARANNDTAHTIFDNLKIESVGKATFVITSANLRVGETAQNYQVRIPPGLNATSNVVLKVVSPNPAVAAPVGAVDGTLTLTFPQGGSNIQNFAIEAKDLGGTTFTIQNSFGLGVGNTLPVTVILGPGVRLEDSFASATLSTNWTVNTNGFEVGAGDFQVSQAAGALTISGTTTTEFWGGNSVRTAKELTATKDLNLVVEVDRVSMEQVGSAGRSGVFISNADRSRFLWFGQNVGETGWQVNENPGTPTGAGTAIGAFAEITDLGSHKLRLVANGETVDIYLDGVFGGTFDFATTTGINVELGAYARALDDTVAASFDNLKISHALPCIKALTTDVPISLGEATPPVSIVIPKLMNGTTTATVTVTSRNPAVAVPAGANNGSITLNFPPGTQTNTFTVNSLSVGVTSFDITSSDASVCVAGPVNVAVTPAPLILLNDAFTGSAIDETKWVIDANPFQEGGTYVADVSGVIVSNGVAKISVTGETAPWGGIALMSAQSFSAGPTAPVSFEVDRTLMEFQLVTGTAAKQRSSFWVSDESRTQFVVVSDYATHDGSAGGWQYNRVIGQAGDTPTTGNGVAIAAFTEARFNDKKNHRVKLTVNGSTVKIYVDGILGAEVPFPVAAGIKFGFGAYVQAATDITSSSFDNARITGTSSEPTIKLNVAREGADLVITWTGSGTLQRASTLVGPNNWSDIPNVPPGTGYRTPATERMQFFRLRL